MTGKLTVGSDGRLRGPASIQYNSPFPTHNGRYGSGAMMGVVEHTMVGNLPGTVEWFNNPASQASAHFGVSQSGEIWQFGPIGKGWIAWHCAAGNAEWYGIEFADDGNPANPLTQAQVTAAAQLVECLSAFAGFPLQVSNSTSVKGYGWHGMGGEAWGGHLQCPGDVRKAQRGQIVALAMAIRSGKPVPPKEGWTAAMITDLPTLSQGATGDDVRTVQGLCTARGHAAAVDGAFGPATASAVAACQQSAGITVDQIVGQQTWTYLVTGSA